MRGQIRIGTSGWSYQHWKGLFYPEKLPQSAWFQHYSKTFDTVEINNTFYHLPDDKTFDAWRQQAPKKFIYAVKASRYLTHLRKLSEPDAPLQTLLDGATRLKNHLGPILYQLPPNWNRNLQRLRDFLEILPKQYRHVIEFRNRDWLCEKTYQLLAEHDVALCVHDMLKRHPRRVVAKFAYVRLHGSGQKYGGKYRTRRLESWSEWIRKIADQHDVFVYFNNDAYGYAVENALTLRTLTQES